MVRIVQVGVGSRGEEWARVVRENPDSLVLQLCFATASFLSAGGQSPRTKVKGRRCRPASRPSPSCVRSSRRFGGPHVLWTWGTRFRWFSSTQEGPPAVGDGSLPHLETRWATRPASKAAYNLPAGSHFAYFWSHGPIWEKNSSAPLAICSGVRSCLWVQISHSCPNGSVTLL